MNVDIRKISVGGGFPDGAIHYQIGKSINLQGAPHTIFKIDFNQMYLKAGKIAYDIYLKSNNDVIIWKTICDVPVVIENNIGFE